MDGVLDSKEILKIQTTKGLGIIINKEILINKYIYNIHSGNKMTN